MSEAGRVFPGITRYLGSLVLEGSEKLGGCGALEQCKFVFKLFKMSKSERNCLVLCQETLMINVEQWEIPKLLGFDPVWIIQKAWDL